MVADVTGIDAEGGSPAAYWETRGGVFAAYAAAVERFVGDLPVGWSVWSRRTPLLTWLQFGSAAAKDLPGQGWKLHVSASPVDGLALVQSLLPELLGFRVRAKLPSRLEGLIHLNSGRAGATQIGKVLTVYPTTDDELRRVVEHLDRRWCSTGAPAIPSDLPVGSSGNLWIRYGSFDGAAAVSGPTGIMQSALTTPSGTIVPDERDERGAQVRWAPAPPVRVARLASSDDPMSPVSIDGRMYLPLKVLSAGPARRTVLAVRMDDLLSVVIKEAVPGTDCDERGNDATSRLANEHRTLRALHGTGCCPDPVAYDADRGRLVCEDLGGEPYALLDREERLARFGAVVGAVAALHERGLVHRDVKLTNVVAGRIGVRLVDLELAAPAGSQEPVAAGTDGYVPPEGRRAAASLAYDIYGIGSSLTHAVLGHCPGRFPMAGNAGRQIALLRLNGQHTAARLVAEALRAEPSARPTAREFGAKLEEAGPALLAELRAGAAVHAGRSPRGPDRRWALTVALGAGQSTKDFRTNRPGGHCWRNLHLQSDFDCEGVNIGAAGIVLGLATIDATAGTDCFAEDITGGAGWLARRPPTPHAHGLFTGNAGVALALAVAGRRIGDEEMLDAARLRLRVAAGAEAAAADADLFSGAAGVVWTGVTLAGILDEPGLLHSVERRVRHLRATARTVDGVLCWSPATEYDRSGRLYYGAAHGSAGVALALAAWARVTGCDATLRLAGDVFGSVYESGRNRDRTNILAASSGTVKPGQYWCHGVAGFLWCLLQAFPGADDLTEIRDWAAAAFAEATPAADNPTMCHGLAGALETWRMLGRLPTWSTPARQRCAQLVRTLRALHVSHRGSPAWTSEDASIVTPDLWVGLLGPAASVAMTADGTHDAMLSEQWLRRCAASATPILGEAGNAS